MKKISSSIAAQASAKQITFGITLLLVVTSLAAYYVSVSSEYVEPTDTPPSMAGTPVPEASALSTNIAGDVGLNAPTGLVVTQTADEEFRAPTPGAEASNGLLNADDRTSRFGESANAGQTSTQASDAGGNSGAGASQARSKSGSVGGAR
jgi:hypothetical protein